MRHIIGIFLVATALMACGSDSDGRAEGQLNGDSVQPYVKTCTWTSCESCRDAAESRYDQCSRLCRSPYASSDCFSQCPSIGDSSCPYACGENERCEEWEATLPLPDRDEGFYEACVGFNALCIKVDQKFEEALCNYQARLFQPRFGDEYRCVLERGCEGAAECFSAAGPPGMLGTETCERSESCQLDCRPSDQEYLNKVEDSLRPSLVDLARRCNSEPTCAEFEACNDALNYLWQLTWHEYSGL
ncbi:MAG TPA: hypothetical protein VJN18_05315 [Polyangiaceae bacterium]|nr:hypothetical protein [Polyangiaceae bacterium]